MSTEQDQQGRELESYLAALAPEGAAETTVGGRQFGTAQVHQLRLQLVANEQLRELAEAQGTSPSALAQEWVMQRLHYEFAQYQQSSQAAAPAWPQ